MEINDDQNKVMKKIASKRNLNNLLQTNTLDTFHKPNPISLTHFMGKYHVVCYGIFLSSCARIEHFTFLKESYGSD